MTTETLHDPVKVGAVFHRGTTRPVWFIWHGQRHDVREVTMYWRTQQGRTTLLHLAVTDGVNAFELVFDQERLTWHLAGVDTGT